jgi:hypothetical protein
MDVTVPLFHSLSAYTIPVRLCRPPEQTVESATADDAPEIGHPGPQLKSRTSIMLLATVDLASGRLVAPGVSVFR